MQTEHDNNLGPSAPIEYINADAKHEAAALETEKSTKHRNGLRQKTDCTNPTDETEEKEQKSQPNTAIDPQALIKFENTMKMRENQNKIALMIRVKIKSMDAMFPIFEVEIDHNLTVSDLKEKIREQSPDNIDPLRQRLIHRGRLMSRESRTLKQCNVREGDTMMLVRSRRNQTVSSRNEGGVNSNDFGRRGRNRAMTLGAPQAMIRRSTTPDPSQTAQVY